jgi:hypothetical protein
MIYKKLIIYNKNNIEELIVYDKNFKILPTKQFYLNNVLYLNNIRGRDNNNNVRHHKDLNNEDILIIKKKLGNNLKKFLYLISMIIIN